MVHYEEKILKHNGVSKFYLYLYSSWEWLTVYYSILEDETRLVSNDDFVFDETLLM